MSVNEDINVVTVDNPNFLLVHSDYANEYDIIRIITDEENPIPNDIVEYLETILGDKLKIEKTKILNKDESAEFFKIGQHPLNETWPTLEDIKNPVIGVFFTMENYEELTSKIIDYPMEYQCYCDKGSINQEILELLKLILDKDIIEIEPTDKLPFFMIKN